MKTATPTSQENLFETRKKAKTWLGIITFFSCMLGIVLVAYSGYSLGQGSGKIVTGFGIFVGLSLALLSFLALYGVCAQSEKVLFAFFVTILTLTLFMIFVVICAFIFTGETSTYVDGNWQDIQTNFAGQSRSQIEATIRTNLLVVACVSLFSLIFMITSLIFTARILGAAKTQSRIMHLVNLLTLILGIFIIVVAAITAFINFSERYIPYILLFVGAAIFSVSFFGYYGTKWRSVFMLTTYTVIVAILTIMLLVLGIICYADKPKVATYIGDHWAEFKGTQGSSSSTINNYIGKVSTYLTLLGSVAIGGVVFMMFAGTVASLLAANIKHGDVDPATAVSSTPNSTTTMMASTPNPSTH